MYPLIGEPLYPELWKGCEFATAPCLGPTGLTLRDWAGYSHHGSLTNMDANADWVLSQGRYALDLDRTNDYIDFGSSAANFTGAITVSAWINLAAVNTGNSGIVCKGNIVPTVAQTSFGLSCLGNTGANFLAWGVLDDANNARIGYITPAVITAGTWFHVLADWDGITATRFGTSVYVNNLLQSISSSEDSGTFVSRTTCTDALEVGRRKVTASFEYFGGLIDDVRIYRRRLSGRERALLASRRGIAYDLAPRRKARLAAFRAYWAARKAQIIGGGL